MLLRYLADAYRALRQTVPEDARTEELWELIEWLGDLVRRTDSSLLDEWERLSNPLDEHGADAPGGGRRGHPGAAHRQPAGAPSAGPRRDVPPRRARRPRGLRRARRSSATSTTTGSRGRRTAGREALDPFYDDHDEILTGSPARGPALFQVTPGRGTWRVRQVLDEAEGDHDWRIDAVVDLAASDETSEIQLRITAVGALLTGWAPWPSTHPPAPRPSSR